MACGRTDIWTGLTIFEAFFFEPWPYLFKIMCLCCIKVNLLFLLPQIKYLSLFALHCFNATHDKQFTHFSLHCCNSTCVLKEELAHSFYYCDTFENICFNIWRVNICLYRNSGPWTGIILHILVHWVDFHYPKSLRQTTCFFCLQLTSLSQAIHKMAKKHLVAFIPSFATFIEYLIHSMHSQCQILFITWTKTGCDVLPVGTMCKGANSWKGKLCCCTKSIQNHEQQDLLSSWSAFDVMWGLHWKKHNTPSLWTSETKKLIFYL